MYVLSSNMKTSVCMVSFNKTTAQIIKYIPVHTVAAVLHTGGRTGNRWGPRYRCNKCDLVKQTRNKNKEKRWTKNTKLTRLSWDELRRDRFSSEEGSNTHSERSFRIKYETMNSQCKDMNQKNQKQGQQQIISLMIKDRLFPHVKHV